MARQKRINRLELERRISEKHGLPPATVHGVCDAIVLVAWERLVLHDFFVFPGIGKFSVRKSHLPEAMRFIQFVPANDFKKAIQEYE